ncbi:MAG: PLP-dependent aspartate aminotransferase family protein [Deltaproteobacteria bacterium]|nr:PLP-dependent aspartate aminotransferase family protein [Deltaproteobacteria bacterium]
MPKKTKPQRNTLLVHAGEPKPRIGGAVVLPVFQSSTFEYDGQSSYHDLKYIRLNNTPNHQTLHAKLAAVEQAEAALVTGSGMAAISTTLLTVLKAGDHLLIQKGLYGGTQDLVTTELPALGIEVSFFDGDRPETWESQLRSQTRAIYVESMSNPLLDIPDLAAVVSFARQHGLVSLIDNTFPSPVNFRPCALGFDLSLHSATKYLNGHSDIVAGAVIGSRPLVDKVLHRLNHLGGSLDPHACFLFHRGVKTLELRMRQHNASALAIATYLESHDGVEKVYYPGLASHPRHARAKELFDGFSGMLSFELAGGAEAADHLFRRLQFPAVAPSLGGVETLITRPATTSHAGMSPEARREAGIGDGLIRLSVGIEDAADLIADLEQGLGIS